MKICCCCGHTADDRLKVLHSLGYDCVEPALNQLVSESEEAVKEYRKKVEAFGMSVASFNCMISGNFKLIGSEYNAAAFGEYLEEAFYKAALTGTKIVTLGSGGARQIPDDVCKRDAKEAFCKILSDTVAPIARKNGIVIGIEPLRAVLECNFLNNCREIMEIVNTVNLPEINLTVDAFHAYFGYDTYEQMVEGKDRVKHVHLASVRTNRGYPTAENDENDLRKLFAALKSIGYEGAISIEGTPSDDFAKSASDAIAVIRKAWQE